MIVTVQYTQTQTCQHEIDIPEWVFEAGISPLQYAAALAQDRINRRDIEWQDKGDDDFQLLGER